MSEYTSAAYLADDYTVDFIMHHGIKGMHWGERRFQNPDGSLTAAGRARYGVGFDKAEARSELQKEYAKKFDGERFDKLKANRRARFASTALKGQGKRAQKFEAKNKEVEGRYKNAQTDKERAKYQKQWIKNQAKVINAEKHMKNVDEFADTYAKADAASTAGAMAGYLIAGIYGSLIGSTVGYTIGGGKYLYDMESQWKREAKQEATNEFVKKFNSKKK